MTAWHDSKSSQFRSIGFGRSHIVQQRSCIRSLLHNKNKHFLDSVSFKFALLLIDSQDTRKSGSLNRIEKKKINDGVTLDRNCKWRLISFEHVRWNGRGHYTDQA
ncbi:unnamed protein product [Albugo candida]|uniref:Uncharacterized protein n=1 Tax=Albugo candida TaxID=65357 RepID=A0A024GRS9_9STRA|nr:unnamed protein product [Albugo candida]|eukprot:CCI49280.1 unnamed protein product [Albugo candida]